MHHSKPSDSRIAAVLALTLVWVLVIGGRLVQLQAFQRDELRARAGRQQQFVIEVSPTRGVIYDRNGHELARSAEVQSLYAAPSQISDHQATAAKLAKLLGVNGETLLKRFALDRTLVVVKRKLTDKEVASVKDLGLTGLSFVPEMKRYYVAGRTASHVLGFVDIDEHGLGGIELSLDSMIRGRGGRMIIDVDALGKPYSHRVEDIVPGADVMLTIDTVIQHQAEVALEQAVRASGARNGMAVVIRPVTGEVLALANYPDFDPNNPSDSIEDARSNRAVEAAYEPGSIFKLVTYSGALEERLIGPTSSIDCGNGSIVLFGRRIADGHAGVMTATHALEQSSNVAAVKVGQMLGRNRLAQYVNLFGFGRRTGVELPAESRGIVREAKDWVPASIAAVPIGHEVGVTALQAAAAFASIAGGGEWVQPFVVSRVTGAGGTVIEQHQDERRRVVTRRTAEELKVMLEGVVLRGTGQLAQVSGYRVAGKTGTAQKVEETTGHYSKTRYVASFAGFAPADNPEVVCIVSIEEPRGVHTGRDVAAPVFARIVGGALEVLGVPPDQDRRQIARGQPMQDLTHRVIVAEPRETDRSWERERARTAEGDTKVPVPRMVGLGVRDAAQLCAERGLKMKATGSGLVTTQSPPPGTLTQEGTVCYLTLSRQ
ncbi:MAG TPA: penicillin-binding protein [Blastocatellia bacterium]|nr:penicillin-binding protein [Blastocatellia bacterium]